MAGINRSAIPGLAVLFGLGGFVLLAIGLLFFAAGSVPLDRLGSRYTNAVLVFTLTQACLSVLLSIVGALPVAIVLSRYRRFWGRALILRQLALPLALPPLVAVLGLLGVWGRSGWIAQGFSLFGWPIIPDVFGLHGVLLAHVFFNLPLAARLMVAHMERQPATLFRLADQLGLMGWTRFLRVEWPLLRTHLPSIAGLIMMLCIGSFTIVLTLGGGPSAATFEVAIYQALRFDFNPGVAALYTLVQLSLAGMILGLLRLAGGTPEDRAGMISGAHSHQDRLPIWGLLVLAMVSLLLIAPLVALTASGVLAEWGRLLVTPRLWSAIGTSLIIALVAALLATGAAYALLVAQARGFIGASWTSRFFSLGLGAVGSAVLAIPPIVLGAGWFLALRGVSNPTLVAGGLVVLVNALMALPFVLRVLGPAFHASERRYGPLAASLGLSGANHFTQVDGPVLARPFAVSLMFGLVLSVGDLGAAAIFGAYDLVTLPILILNLMGSYRTDDAAGVAFLLALFVLILIALAERTGKLLQ